MRIGVTYDLRSDYLALGLGEEETAEFDAEETIASVCQALIELLALSGEQYHALLRTRSLVAWQDPHCLNTFKDRFRL